VPVIITPADLILARTPRADRRKQVIALTERGVAAHDQIAAIRTKFSHDTLSCLDAEEQARLFEYLRRLQASADMLSPSSKSGWLDD
jgi:DNA-binding MarR family transcriptional regulator